MDFLNPVTVLESIKHETDSIAKYQFLIIAIFGSLAVWGPRLFKFVKERIENLLMVQIVVAENDNMAGSWLFYQFSKFVLDNSLKFFNKTFEANEKGKLRPGEGRRIVKYKGSYFFIHISRESSENNRTVVKLGNYTVLTFRWNKHLLEELLEKLEEESVAVPTSIYELLPNDWNWQGYLPAYIAKQPRLVSLDTYNQLDAVFERMKLGKEVYFENQKPYKETVLLYGPPGTGKTSLVRSLVVKHDVHLLKCSPEDLTSKMLTYRHLSDHLMGKRKFVVILVEDIDSNPNFCIDAEDQISRSLSLMKSENTNEIITDTPKPKSSGSIFTIGGSRAELLNGLDGITPPHEVLIILSSNHPDKLYKSIYRNGRVDEYIHVDYLKKEEIKSVLGWKDDNPLFEPIAEYDKGLSASSLSRLRHAKNISDVIKILDKNTKAQSISTEVFDI